MSTTGIGATATALPAEAHQDDTFQTARVCTIAAGHWVHDSYTAFLAPLLVVFKETLALTNAQAGLLSVFMQEASLLQPVIGGLADRFNVRYFVVFAPAVTGIAMSLLGVAPSYLTLAILLTVAGLSSACLHAVGPVLIGNVAGRRLGTGMSIWMVGGEAGRFVGPLVIGAALTTITLRHTPWLMLGGLVTSAILLATLKDEGASRQRRAAQAASGVRFRDLLRERRAVLPALMGFIAVSVVMSAALATYLPILMHEEGDSLWLASVALSVFQAAGVAGAFAGGTLSDHLGRRRLLLAAMLPTGILMLIFVSATGWWRYPLLLLLGFTSLSINPVVMAVVQETFPQNRAMANGAYMAFSFLVRSVIVLTLGWLGDMFGMHVPFTVSAVVTLLSLPLVLALPERPRPVL